MRIFSTSACEKHLLKEALGRDACMALGGESHLEDLEDLEPHLEDLEDQRLDWKM